MKKTKKKVRKLSKSEKSIANQMAYLKRKVKVLKAEMFESRENSNFNPEKLIKDKFGNLKKQKTIEADIANEAKDLNTKILKLEQKRALRFKKYKPKPKTKNIQKKLDSGKYDILDSYTAWERNDFMKDISLTDYDKVMGKKTEIDLDVIIDEIIETFLKMGSEELLTAYEKTDEPTELIYEVTYDPEGVKEKRG